MHRLWFALFWASQLFMGGEVVNASKVACGPGCLAIKDRSMMLLLQMAHAKSFSGVATSASR